MFRHVITALTVSLAAVAIAVVALPDPVWAQSAESPAEQPESAEATPAPAAAPGDACKGMIAPDKLKAACDSLRQTDKAWRQEIGLLLGQLVLDYVDTTAGGDKEASAAEKVQVDQWVIDLSKKIEQKIHEREFKAVQRDQRHVIMAYAALWVLMLGFVVFMWSRQKGLKAEIALLQREIARAAQED